jgi:hypothetical protein
MDQHKKRRRRRGYLHIRKERLLTLLGSLIIFATFIVKEGVGENLKDLTSSIESAKNIFVLREDIASVSAIARARDASYPKTPDEMKKTIDQWDLDIKGILSVCLGLAAALPDEVQIRTTSNRITDEEWNIATAVVKLPDSRRVTEDQLLDSMRALFNRSSDNFSEAYRLRLHVVDEADQLKEIRQRRYTVAKWLSYILFAFGWGLTFYGQLSGKTESSTETGG